MAENQEQIESRLCGYVDETLNSAEQAEIEAHLQAHPQHRQLLAELRKMRDAMRALPRESAPAEMSESFTGQLERSVLLDGIGHESAEPRMRITRMPQFAAIAAIVMLAVGLGFVIYFTSLPGSKTPLAQNTKSPNIPPNIDGVGEPSLKPASPSNGGGGAQPSGGQIDQAHVVQASPPAPAVSLLPPGQDVASAQRSQHEDSNELDKAAATPQMAAIANSALASKSVRQLLGRTSEADRGKTSGLPTLVMVVATADPAATNRKLDNYLEIAKADWQSAPALDTEKSVDGAYGNTASRAVAGRVGMAMNAPHGPGASGGDDVKGNPTTMPQTKPDAFVSAAGASGANGPTTGQSGVEQRPEIATNAQKDELQFDKNLKQMQSRVQGTDSRLYVVHNLSFQQAKKLGDLLRQGDAQTAAPLFADQAGDGATDAIARGNEPKSSGALNQIEQTPTPPVHGVGPMAPPSTQPIAAPQASNSNEHGDLVEAAQPATKPAAPAASIGIVPVDNQTLLGSSPVDLVIVIQNTPAAQAGSAAPAAPGIPATAPTTIPADVPTTNPATEPTTAPEAMPVRAPIAD